MMEIAIFIINGLLKVTVFILGVTWAIVALRRRAHNNKIQYWKDKAENLEGTLCNQENAFNNMHREIELIKSLLSDLFGEIQKDKNLGLYQMYNQLCNDNIVLKNELLRLQKHAKKKIDTN